MTVSDKQLKLLAFPYTDYECLIADGAIRSGKTSIMFVSFVRWAMERFDGQKLILLGNTVESAVRNVLDPFMSMTYAKRRWHLDYNGSKHILTIRKGNRENRIHVFGANNARSYRLIQGMTAAGCFVDEVTLCERSAVEQALARCSVDGSRYWFNCNPDHPRHWFYTEWVLRAKEHNALHLHFTLDDNPALSDEIKARYDRQYHGVFHDRYVKGLWVVAEGLVYQFDSESEYTCSAEEAMGDGSGQWYVSIDYGITNPFAALLWRVTRNRAYVVDTYYFDSKREGRRKTDSEHYESLEALARGHNIESVIIDPSANSFKEEIYRHGRFDVINADNSVLDGIATTDQMLHDGSIKVNENLHEFMAEMNLYRWDETKNHDAVIKESDHIADSARYMSHTVLRYVLEGYA